MYDEVTYELCSLRRESVNSRPNMVEAQGCYPELAPREQRNTLMGWRTHRARHILAQPTVTRRRQ